MMDRIRMTVNEKGKQSYISFRGRVTHITSYRSEYADGSLDIIIEDAEEFDWEKKPKVWLGVDSKKGAEEK